MMVDDYLLGNGALHERFCALTEVLAKFVSHAPRAVTLAQLEDYTGRSAKDIAKLCGSLWRAQLLRPEGNAHDSWVLTCKPSSITLEDVFRCLTAEQRGNSKPIAKLPQADHPHPDVDLFIMQASITINQSVFKHLRQFSLDRLKISAAGAPPNHVLSMQSPHYDDVVDLITTH